VTKEKVYDDDDDNVIIICTNIHAR